MRGLCAASIVAGLWMGSAPAAAGDFYIRGGLGLERPSDTRFTDRDCASRSPAALYGCGRGGDGAPTRSSGDFATAGALELGIGRVVTPTLRIETRLEYRPRLAFGGRTNFLAPGRRQSVAADLATFSALLAAQLDLPGLGFGAAAHGPIVPFVGAGAGVVRVRIGETRMMFPRTTTTVPGASRTDFAWMATAGLAAPLDKRTTFELAWRYTDLGEVRTGRGPGQVVWRDGGREPLPLDLAATRGRLRGHGLWLSLRVAI